ncbi:hypothetical protein [Psychrobacter immobilis]|uniref:hypothetical protein n=1 Tax=Psychrobacter immobilis TaxID=498 RepID=UPI001918BEBD|nr:hypothetical protein [Psychrobacter immobilis]
MAASRPMPRNARQSYRRQALIWLMTTLLLGVITALVWMFSQTPAMGAKIENAPISAPQALSTELEQPVKIESLHELDTDVQPIKFDTTVRDLRSYPDEFKDKRYLLANKGKWTVQVMNVAENEVIVSYLEGREDREKFAYFRYLDNEKQVRYMLTYGIMSSPQEAVGAAKLIDFKLPSNVRVLPEEINRYAGIIDNYERPDPIKDLSAKRTRSVSLKPTKREVPVRQQTQDTDNDQNASNNANGSGQAAANNNGGESIRQSSDTSATFSVNEERIVGDENQSSSVTPPRSEDGTSKSQGTSNTDNSAPKKPPVVATPKPPSNSTNSANNNSSKSNSDSLKALIEDKSN